MPKTLWLTYAWVDNEEADVDFVAGKLRSHGVEVRLDRTQIVAGRRLWQQIDANLQASDLNGFAIYATENSLRSEACQEELAIALDRVLRQKGTSFPLIGIFPAPIERALIPSAIATRLFVYMKDESWSSRVAAALSGTVNQSPPAIEPYYFREHRVGPEYVYEMRPRDGIWLPSIVAFPPEHYSQCREPYVWAKGQPDYRPPMFRIADVPEQSSPNGERWRGYRVDEQADIHKSLYLRSTVKLRRLIFGCERRVQYRVDVSA